MTPHDAFAERVVVGSLLAGQDVDIDPLDIHDPHLRLVAETCRDLIAKQKPVDALSVRSALLKRGQRTSPAIDGVWLVELAESAMPGAQHHATTLRSLALRRRLLAELERSMQDANNPTVDPADIAASLTVSCTTLADGHQPQQAASAQDLYDFLDGPMDYDWLVPGLLEKGDRLLITGGEGSGKSVALRQLAVATAAGVNPFTGVRNDPRKVLLVDLENGQRTLRRHLIGLRQHCDLIGRPVPLRGLTVESLPAGTDLTRADGEAWLTALAAEHQPDLLVIGPLYRMHARNMNDEEPARQLTRVVDAIRSRHGCAVAMETHAPHMEAGRQQRNLRPVGSSLFMRWPEFGFGLRPVRNPDPHALALWQWVPWRGPREERGWPKLLRRGQTGEWPWVAADEQESVVRQFWQEVEGA